MKTQRKTLLRLAVVALAAILTLALAVPAMAVEPVKDPLTITIHNNTGLPAMADGQFTAYQLFAGKVNAQPDESVEPGTSVDPNPWGAEEWTGSYSLANITWGADITAASGESLIKALQALTFAENGSNPDYAPFFKEGANIFAGINGSAGNPKAASELAYILEANTDNAFLQKFSKFIVTGGYLTGDGTDSTATVDKGDHAKDVSKIDVNAVGAGYYLVVENATVGDPEGGKNNDDAVSEYILAVLGGQDIYMKASIPEVDKDIVNGNHGTEGDVAGINDVVNFKLSGKPAKNIADFDTYYFEFVDTLSAGLTYLSADPAPVLKLLRGGVEYTIDASEYTINTAEAGTEGPKGTTITITFTDLRQPLTVTAPEATELTVTADDTIYVYYSARVDKDAIIGSTGNPNDVHIVYSNDPSTADKGRTHDVEVHVYTFGLDLTKVDKDTHEGLSGAEFVLTRATDGKYAQFENVTGAEGNVTGRRLTGWTETSYEDATETDKANYLLTSGADGKIPDVTGLDEGTYTLTEVKTPADYNTMDPFVFTITADIDATSGALKSVTYQHVGEDAIVYDNEHNTARFTSGLLPDDLENQKAPLLPFTGGIGTTIFYIAGGLLIVLAAAYLVATGIKRKNAAQKENA